MYGGENLLKGYNDTLEQLLWRVVWTFRNTANLSRELGNQARQRGDAARAADYEARARNDEEQAEAARRMIGMPPPENQDQK